MKGGERRVIRMKGGERRGEGDGGKRRGRWAVIMLCVDSQA